MTMLDDLRRIHAAHGIGRVAFDATGLADSEVAALIDVGYLIEEPPGYVCLSTLGEQIIGATPATALHGRQRDDG